MATAPTIHPPQHDQSILEKTVCVVVGFKMPGNQRSVPKSAITVSADKEMLSVSKKLWDSKELAEVFKVPTRVREFLKSRCLPSLFKEGIYLLPFELVTEVEAKLKEFQVEFALKIDAFILVYDVATTQAMVRLNKLADTMDYPPKAQLLQKFGFTWHYVTFATPEKLKAVNKEIFENQKQKMETSVQEATDEIRKILRQTMLTFVNDMVSRLKPGEDGKKKIIKPSKMLQSLTDFLQTFDVRNITDDDDLRRIKDQAAALLKGVDAENLCSQETVREKVCQGFEELQKQMEPLIGTAGKRAFIFGDDDEE